MHSDSLLVRVPISKSVSFQSPRKSEYARLEHHKRRRIAFRFLLQMVSQRAGLVVLDFCGGGEDEFFDLMGIMSSLCLCSLEGEGYASSFAGLGVDEGDDLV
jgi:hypothetical protein